MVGKEIRNIYKKEIQNDVIIRMKPKLTKSNLYSKSFFQYVFTNTVTLMLQCEVKMK